MGALAVAVAACGGSDGEAERESARATTSTTVASSTSAATTPSTAAAPTVAAGPRRSSTTTAVAATAPTTGATPAAGLAFTPPGTYRYTTTGHFTSSLTGPQARNGSVVLTVDPPSGPDQRSVRSGVGRITQQVLRLDAGGAYLVSLRLTDNGLDKEVRPAPPALALPADASPGRMWSWRATSTDGRTTVDSSFKAVRTEDVTVRTERVATLVVEVVLTLSGDIVSTSRQTLWVSPRQGLVVRQDESTEGRFGVIPFSATSSDILVSLTPG